MSKTEGMVWFEVWDFLEFPSVTKGSERESKHNALDLNELSIYELFEDLLNWNLEFKLITPKNITGIYFGAIIAIFNFSLSFYFL